MNIKTIKVPAGKIKNNDVSAFEIGETPITCQQWIAVMGSLPEDCTEEGYKPNQPVTNVSFYDAEEFCKKLSEQTGETYRLPSGDEWEHACRAGTTGKYHCNESELEDYAVFNRAAVTDVKTKKPNAFGLYDMHGLVWEWTTDTTD